MLAKDRTGHFCAWRACSTACEVSLGKDLLVAASCETKRLPNQRFIDHWTMLNVWQNQDPSRLPRLIPEPTGLEPAMLVLGRGGFIEKLGTTRF
jgi:hypothetical protein